MSDEIISLIAWIGMLALMGVVASVSLKGKVKPLWFGLAILLFALNVALVLDFAGIAAQLKSWAGDPELSFNWGGKIVALTASVLIFWLVPGFDRKTVGLALPLTRTALLGWGVLAVLIGINVAIALAIETGPQPAETIAYQLLMPSLDEELFYRGIFLAALVRAFGDGPRLAGANMGWAAAITAVMFAVIHSVFWTGDSFFISYEDLASIVVIGLVLVWLRQATGSLLAPIILHSAINTLWRVM